MSMEIIQILTPYIILIITLVTQHYYYKKRERPIINCQLLDNRIIFENKSDYNAFNFEISPNLKLNTFSNLILKDKSNIKNNKPTLYARSDLTYILNDINIQSIRITYNDSYNKIYTYDYIVKQNLLEEDN